jgi:hypothetical protein
MIHFLILYWILEDQRYTSMNGKTFRNFGPSFAVVVPSVSMVLSILSCLRLPFLCSCPAWDSVLSEILSCLWPVLSVLPKVLACPGSCLARDHVLSLFLFCLLSWDPVLHVPVVLFCPVLGPVMPEILSCL